MLAKLIMCATASLLTTAAIAQVPNPSPTRELPQDRGFDVDTPKHQAVDASEAPVTRDLNATAQQQAAGNAIAGEVDQEQYRLDMAAYHDALMANKADGMRDQIRFQRQQRAYADAMAQWRVQEAACAKGKVKACRLPTPNPADYY